jgi:hypothetical protein
MDFLPSLMGWPNRGESANGRNIFARMGVSETMIVRNSMALGLALTLAVVTAKGQRPAESEPLPTVADIMAKVAANQDHADAERAHYVYLQHAHVTSRKGKTVMCDEVTDARITPSSNGSQTELIKLNGRLLHKGQYVTYTTLPAAQGDPKAGVREDHDSLSVELGGDEADRDLVENMRSGLTNDDSKDGIAADLFPLTSKSQSDYLFQLMGRERMNGRDVFHVEFRPKDKDDYGWKGDAYIDTTAYQPVVVSTSMARKIPFGVRTLLGTDLPGLGFTVVYAPHADGAWFPVSFGTEFKLHVLFFFNREIVIDDHNSNFEKTHVSSKIVADGAAIQPQ